MAIELEGLEFQIESSSDKAAKGVDALVASLNRLNTAVSGNANFTKFANSMNQLSSSLNGLDAKLNNLAQSFGRLNSLNNVQISSSVPKNISQIAHAVNGISPSSISNLNNLGAAMQNLGAMNLQPAVANLGALSGALSGLHGIGRIRIPGNLASRINAIANAAGNMNPNTVGNLTALGGALGSLRALSNLRISGDIANQIRNIAAAANSISPNAAANLTALSNAVRSMSSVSGSIRQVTQSVTTAVPKVGLLHNVFVKSTSAAKSLFTSIAGLPILIGSRLAAAVKNATSSLGGFLSRIKRIIMYRAIRSMIKAITQGFSEGLKNLYNYSLMIGGQFAQSMDRLASSTLYLKNSLGAMAAPIVNALAPAIEFIIDKIVTLLNLINQLFAKLGGQSSYTAAKKVATQWGDAAKSASGSAKKASDDIKRYLLGFDELNILGKPDSGSGTGSGGGSGTGVDYSSMFEEREIDDSVGEFATRLKEAFINQDWFGLGEIVGDKVNEGIDAIDWAGIGTGIGTKLTAAIQTSYSFLKTVDFEKLGSGLATSISNAIKNIDWNTLGRLTVRKFTLVLDTLIGFVKEFDFQAFGTAIHDGVLGIFGEAKEWLDSHEWDEFGGKLIKDLKDLLAGLNLGEVVSEAFSTLGTVIRSAGELIGGALGEITLTIEDWWDGLPGDNAGEKLLHGLGEIGDWTTNNVVVPFVSALTGIDESEIEYTWNKIGDFIAESMADAIKWFEEAGKAVKDYIEELGEHAVFDNPFAEMHEDTGTDMGEIAIRGILGGAASIPVEIEQWKVDVIPIIEETGKMFSNAGKAAQAAETAITTFFNKTTGYKSDYPALGKLEKVLEDINYYSRNTSTLDLVLKPVKTIQETIGNPVELDIIINKLTKPFKELLGIEDPMTESVTLQKDPKSKTVAEIFGTAFDVFAKLKDKSNDSKTVQGVFGTVTDVVANLTGKNAQSKSFESIFGRTFDVVAKLAGKNASSKTYTGIFGSTFDVVAKLTGKNASSKTYTSIFGSTFDVVAKLTGKNASSKTLTGIFGNTINVLANLGKGKVSGTSTTASLPGVFGNSFVASANIKAGVVQGTSKTASLNNLFGSTFTVVANVAKQASGHAAGGAVSDTGKITRFASGGAISNMSREMWNATPKYAGGGRHGSLFVAGEAGPEIVGHVNGRSEILNKSQMAQTMYAATVSGIATVVPYLASINGKMRMEPQISPEQIEAMIETVGQRANSMFYGEESTDKIADGVREGIYDSIDRQNELLRRQNELLQQIANKDMTVEVTANSIVRALSQKNWRDGKSVVTLNT